MSIRYVSQFAIISLALLFVMLHPTPSAMKKVSPDRPGSATEPAQEERGRFRVTMTGFRVNTATTESAISTDGMGDEVYFLANFVEVLSSNNIIGSLQRKQSLIYGDTAGHRQPVAITGSPLFHPTQPGVVQAGTASPTGGLLTGNMEPIPGQTPVIPLQGQPINETTRARLLPMVIWEGELRKGGRLANAIVLIPTLWENDNVRDVLNVWNRQVDQFLRRFAADSARFFTSSPTNQRRLVEQVDNVLTTVPQRNDFDRPIGIGGDAYNPTAAIPGDATFIPAVLFLTYSNATIAVSTESPSRVLGGVEISYQDGTRYGPGDYTVFLRIERLP